jgi:uncharacterized membrane protein
VIHPRGRAARKFAKNDLLAVAAAIDAAKSGREGEIVVVVENALSHRRLARGTTPRQRSMEIFAKYHVWDTEANDGILVHVLMADRHVAVVADRGIDRKVPAGTWEEATRTMESAFRKDRFREGVMEGIARIAGRLPQRAVPKDPPYELPSLPLVV